MPPGGSWVGTIPRMRAFLGGTLELTTEDLNALIDVFSPATKAILLRAIAFQAPKVERT
jgi:hypothetical protein